MNKISLQKIKRTEAEKTIAQSATYKKKKKIELVMNEIGQKCRENSIIKKAKWKQNRIATKDQNDEKDSIEITSLYIIKYNGTTSTYLYRILDTLSSLYYIYSNTSYFSCYT